MGFFKWLLEGSGHDVTELARRLDVDRKELLRLNTEIVVSGIEHLQVLESTLMDPKRRG